MCKCEVEVKLVNCTYTSYGTMYVYITSMYHLGNGLYMLAPSAMIYANEMASCANAICINTPHRPKPSSNDLLQHQSWSTFVL